MAEKKPPLIGVVPLVDEGRDSYWMLPGYFEGVLEAGGVPIMLPLTDDPEVLAELVSSCSGILVTGGQDVSPDALRRAWGRGRGPLRRAMRGQRQDGVGPLSPLR